MLLAMRRKIELTFPVVALPSILLSLIIVGGADGVSDFSLVCRKGYRLTSIRRANSAFQRSIAGSLSVECERIVSGADAKQVKCEAMESTPQCNGFPEGCNGSQWLGGFHAYSMDNSTNVFLLDPICCSSPQVQIDSTSCASERLNIAKMPFEHILFSADHAYRGMQCWHQYNSSNVMVDLVWKMEICQYSIVALAAPVKAIPMQNSPMMISNINFMTGDSVDEDSYDYDSTSLIISPAETARRAESARQNAAATATSSPKSEEITYGGGRSLPTNCAPCKCHCGIDLCGNGAEPIRIVHKAANPHKCSCDCSCKFECI